jgi:solute carrier family 25 oxoglutarate transporter 11
MVAREMVDFWPKKNGVCPWNGNYRKAAVWIYYHEFSSTFFAGFFTNYFFRCAPGMFLSLGLADSLGMFEYTSVDLWSGAGTNSWEYVIFFFFFCFFFNFYVNIFFFFFSLLFES